jgi:thiamine-phosphate pyrophosphorylase
MEARRPIVCYVSDRNGLLPGGRGDATPSLLETIQAAVAAGVDWIQIREKDLPGRPLLRLVREATAAAKRTGEARGADARVYVNDRLDVALVADASGVHLGAESLAVADVADWRRQGHAPAGFQLGVSCHSTESAREAEQKGADYIFFGPIFDTPSKRPFGPPQGTKRLGSVCRAIQIPVLAIGGVNETNAEECIRSGAWGVAAIRLFQEADQEALRRFTARLHESAQRG